MHPAPPFEVGPAKSDDDLRAILSLQASNHHSALSKSERLSQGFLSLRHSLESLREMNAPWPHTVARAGTEVVGYALVTLPRHAPLAPDLSPMFARFESTPLHGKPIAAHRYFVMGQVCVAREHRGKGLLGAMYRSQARQMREAFDWSVTEINADNARSLAAHAREGWSEIDRYPDESGRFWAVVALDLHRE
ncbi:MAG TPA: GNAT family N-acetyltransferase [Phycisphaerales bacterium]|nr:GNAT family N-acetyltransferase [Phycisphaerales bacterium]